MKYIRLFLSVFLSVCMTVSCMAGFCVSASTDGQVTITFVSNGGTAVSAITVESGEIVEAPISDPQERAGNLTAGAPTRLALLILPTNTVLRR